MKLNDLIKKILPGIFLIGFTIGTGSVTAMIKSGADFGMALLWALVLSCLFTYYLIHMFGKFTVVTNFTFLQAIRHHIHPALAIFFIVALGVNVSGSIMGVMGIVADVLQEWSKTWIDGGISSLIWAISITFFIIIMFMIGNTASFKNALSIMVAIMAVSFIANAVIMFPALNEIISGLAPNIPVKNGSSAFLVAAGMVGTTLAPVVLVARSILVKEQGWRKDDLKTQKIDAIVSGIMIFLISASIMASAAGILFVQGITLIHTSEMVNILKPVAGIFAVNIFVLGITAAGISSQFPNIFVVPWVISDYKGEIVDMKSRTVRIIVICMSLIGIAVPLFDAQPILVMVASQALNAILLPLTVGSIMYLCNSKKLMGDYKASSAQNLVFGVILVFAIAMCASGIYGLMN